MRQIILDTETTGLEPSQGHRIIEIGCVEMVDRRITGKYFHEYINPLRDIDAGAERVHGISRDFLSDKPTFEQIAEAFVEFVKGAELIIHNAPFDIGFLNHELKLMAHPIADLTQSCKVIDTLVMARKMRPGQKNNLDALCKHYGVDNSNRELHGALLDSEILAKVYLAMTTGQDALFEEAQSASGDSNAQATQVIERLSIDASSLKVLRCSEAEEASHQAYLDSLQKSSHDNCVWLKSE